MSSFQWNCPINIINKEIPKLKPFNHITMTFILSCIFNLFLFQQRKKKASQQSVIQSILQPWQSKKKLVGGPVNKKSILQLCAVQCEYRQIAVLRVKWTVLLHFLHSEQMILKRQGFFPPQAIKCQAITLCALG